MMEEELIEGAAAPSSSIYLHAAEPLQSRQYQFLYFQVKILMLREVTRQRPHKDDTRMWTQACQGLGT